MYDFKDFIRRRFFTEPGVRVLRSQGLTLEVISSPQKRDLAVFHDLGNLGVTMELAGQQSMVAVTYAGVEQWKHVATTEAAAQQLYHAIRTQLSRGRTSPWRPAMAVVAALALIMVLAPRAPAGVAVAQPTTQIAMAPTISPAAPAASPQTIASPQERKLIEDLQGKFIATGTGPSYYVFSDPNCPFCKQLEASMASVKNRSAVVMPLGYKDGSRDLSAAVLCSANPAQEWAQVMASGRSSVKPCEKGYAQVAQNMKAFEALGLSATPTMITPSGMLVAGAASPQELTMMLAQ
jgi:hypothetical protein